MSDLGDPVTDLVARYRVDALQVPDHGARVMRPELDRVDVHWHDYYELSLVVAGTADHVVNGRSHVLRPGDAFLLSPADFHAIDAGGARLVCFNTVIDPALVERQLAVLEAAGVSGFPWSARGCEDLGPDLERLRRESDRPGPGSALVVEGLVACLVVELARRAGVAHLDGAARLAGDDLRGALAYVDRHFREPLTLAEVAAQAHLSPNWFSERFRAHTGVSFQRHLQDRRLQFARSLLAATPLSVTEVCHAAGFGSLSHFGRAYRRRYGRSPSQRVSKGASGTPGDDAERLGPQENVTTTTRIH